MARGKMGPRRILMKATATALPTREGMNHTDISKLLDFEVGSYRKKKGYLSVKNVPDCQKYVDK